MAGIIKGNIAINSGRDGFHIRSNDPDIIVEGNEARNSGRHGFYVAPSKNDLIEAGLKPDTPEPEIRKAYQVLSHLDNPTDEQKAGALKGVGFSRYVNNAAALSTIASLILQMFSK